MVISHWDFFLIFEALSNYNPNYNRKEKTSFELLYKWLLYRRIRIRWMLTFLAFSIYLYIHNGSLLWIFFLFIHSFKMFIVTPSPLVDYIQVCFYNSWTQNKLCNEMLFELQINTYEWKNNNVNVYIYLNRYTKTTWNQTHNIKMFMCIAHI